MEQTGNPATDDRFGLVFLILFFTVAIGALSFGSRLMASVAVLAEAIALIVIYRVVHVGRRAMVLAYVLAAAAAVSLVASVWVGPPEFGLGLQSTVGFMIAVSAPWVIVRRLITHTTITIHTVVGAMCLYLLIGLAVTYLLLVGDRFIDEPLLQGNVGDPLELADGIYFSFITLTTIGYGDIAPANGFARAVAIGGGLVGQLYLVSAIALLVGRLGTTLKPRRD